MHWQLLRRPRCDKKIWLSEKKDIEEKDRNELLAVLPGLFNFDFQKEKSIPVVFICPITAVDSQEDDG